MVKGRIYSCLTTGMSFLYVSFDTRELAGCCEKKLIRTACLGLKYSWGVAKPFLYEIRKVYGCISVDPIVFYVFTGCICNVRFLKYNGFKLTFKGYLLIGNG